MPFDDFLGVTALLVVLLNPFLLAVYLVDLVRELDARTFARVLIRASWISFVVFALVALVGERLFRDVLQVRYASFLLFGGLVFLLVGVRMVFSGPGAFEQIRGEPEHIAGSVAMPFLIGPGTVNASVLAGARLPYAGALMAIAVGMAVSIGGLAATKVVLDRVRRRNEALVARYLDVLGRIGSLIVGSIAIDMILTGIELWIAQQ